MIRHNPLKTILWVLVLALGAAASSYAAAASAPVPKNIILIITDDQNVDSLPVMRKLMSFPEGSWVNFTHAIVNDTICCPARASLLTGQYAFVSGVISNGTGDRLDDTNTLPVWLDNAGYRTALIGKYLNNYPWDKGAGYIPPGWDSFQVMSSGKSAYRTDLAIDFIDSGPGPFFIYLAFMEPHTVTKPLPQYADADVYVAPNSPNFNEADVSDKPAWIRQLSPISQADMDTWHQERVNSQRTLLGVDDSVQRLMDALKARGLLDSTMILYLGDHGFSWGSHRWYKKECVYEECIRFPLLIRYPGLALSREESRLVSNVDLASTIAEFAGVTPGLVQSGHSLVPLINGDAAGWEEAVFMEMHGGSTRTFDGIRVPGWTYAEYANGDKELYDLTADPFEERNRANQPDFQVKQAQLAQQMRDLKNPPPGQPPIALFTNTCTELACAFNASGSSDPDGSITGYAWDFGDGGSGSGVNPSHTYAAANTYNVTLIVTDNDGRTGRLSKQITVSGSTTPTPTPTPTLTPPPGPVFQGPGANSPVTSSAGDNNGFQGYPTRAYTDDGQFAVDTDSGTTTGTGCLGTGKDKHIFYNYNLFIPAGAVVKGIEVRLDAKADSALALPKLCVQISWDGGLTWTSAKSTPVLGTNESTNILGSPSIVWGRTWKAADFTNANFRVRVASVSSSTVRDFSLDWVAVRVTYKP